MLSSKAHEIKVNTMKSILEVGTGHVGSSFSYIEMMVYLYYKQMNVELIKNKDNNRDVFVLSKGHGSPSLYEVLKDLEIETSPMKLRELGSPYQGHPDCNKCHGVEVSTGSLGQGLANAVGIALNKKINKYDGFVYVIVGDGEMQEGIVYEALQFASINNLDNLVILIDNNELQLGDYTKDITPQTRFEDLACAMKLDYTCIDGHDFDAIASAINKQGNRPLIIDAITVKGKGVSVIEGQVKSHGYMICDEDLCEVINNG